ncbi:hypothetical protein MRX96_034607 [Rhipicephalus microplus]
MDPKRFYGRAIPSDGEDSQLSGSDDDPEYQSNFFALQKYESSAQRRVNAWLLYKRNALSKRDEYAERLLPLVDFKMDLAASLCKAGKTVVKKRGRPSNESIEQASQEKRKRGPTAPALTEDVRLDQVGHWVLWSQKRQRCKFPGCTGICMSYCVKCEVHLCSTNKSNCFFCTTQQNECTIVVYLPITSSGIAVISKG